MQTPLISIVTPSFNQFHFLENAVTSVFGQCYPSTEYVVVDGGSDDGSADFIRKYESELTYWVSEPDRGHGDALNKGFAKTSGEIMAWLNSDDMYTPWAFSVVAEIFEQFPEVEWITGINAWWNASGQLTNAVRQYRNQFDFLTGNYGWIQQESTFWRRSLWDKAGGFIDTSYKFMVDGSLWGRFFEHADLYHVSSVLAGYRKHGTNRAAAHLDECHREMERVVDGLVKNVDAETLRIVDALQQRDDLWNHRLLPSRIKNRIDQRKFQWSLDAAAYRLIDWNSDSERWEIQRRRFR